MSIYNQFVALLKILVKDKYKTGSFLGIKRSNDNKKEKSKSKKILMIIGIAFLVILLASYIVIFVAMGTVSAINSGLHKEFMQLLLAMTQLAVFFFGITATMGYLYFSKDNSLLSTLPLDSKAIFLAKFSMAYLTEFLISAFFVITTMTTYGITSFVQGLVVGIEFYILILLAVIIIPIMPLLIVTFISLPVMKLITMLKKNSFSQSIVISIVFIGLMSIYFIFINSFSNNVSQEGELFLSPQLIGMINIAKNGFIFNNPLVDAMLGLNIIMNTLFYVIINAIGLAVAVFLSSIFYSRSINTLIEGTGKLKSKGFINESKIMSNRSSFLKKEIKTLINSPMLFMQSIMGVVLAPLITIIMGFTYLSMGEDFGEKALFYGIGFILYISSLIINATNMVSMIGFSREGKHLFVLKSLPISAKDMVDSKLNLSLVMATTASFLVSVSFVFVAKTNILIGLGLFLTLITISFASTCFSLKNDLKNPNLNWKNINELTKNNKKSLKPALLMLVIGIIYFVYGIIMATVDAFSIPVAANIYFGSCILVNILIGYISYKRLYDNPQELFNEIEG